MSKATRILFITSEEHGQASVHVNLSATLAARYSKEADVHLLSFDGLRSRCPTNVTFHAFEGVGLSKLYMEKWRALNPGKRPSGGVAFSHKPTLLSSARAIMGYPDLMVPWSNSEYLGLVQQTLHFLADIQPDLVLIDIMGSFAMDACRQAKVKAATLSPVSYNLSARHTLDRENKEFALQWPSAMSGYPYPLPWYLRPANLLHMIWSGLWFLLLSPRFRSLKRARTAAGFDSPLPYFDLVQPVLCSGTMALDLPANPSDRVIAFGPILQQYPPLQDTDPEMAAWLAKGGKGKTIMVVLGSLFRFDEAEVRKMMSAVAEVLRKRQDMQVLWKLAPDAAHEGARGDLESMVQRLEGRLTVVDWLRADPAALLQTGYIGAAVHHGGANSYHEALSAGVPHVIIAGWADCYDFAQRATELDIGVWANKVHAPSISSGAISSAILRVIGVSPSDPLAAHYARSAAQAALVCRDADAMPRAPGTNEELQVVLDARAKKGGATQTAEGATRTDDKGKVYVEGRDVAAEWVYRLAVGDATAIAQ